MNQKGFANIIILIIVVAAIAGIGGYFALSRQVPLPGATPTPTPILTSTPTPAKTSNPIQNPSSTPIPISAVTPKLPVQSQSPKNIPQAHNIFGFNSIKILAKEEGNKNVFISPSSIALALSMVYNGANGETKNAMQKTLQFQNLSIATINQESLGLINSLKNPDPQVELSVANSVWAKIGADFKKDFLNTVASYFNATISNLDFSDPNAAKTINAWVSKNTQGKIPSIVSFPIPGDLVMYLINAVYFKGSWTVEFDKKLTEDKNFTTAEGISKKHPLMRQRGNMSYLETEDFQSVNLPYGKNKRLSMYVFLPKNLNNFVQTLDESKWNNWMKRYGEMEGTILLPRFTMEYEKGLIPLLTKLGMGIAFQNNADLTGIGKDLKISEVKHKTYVDVNEEGTEAAAVTSVGISITSVESPEKTFYMEVNRPFFFVIRDNQTQEILFMGTIQNP